MIKTEFALTAIDNTEYDKLVITHQFPDILHINLGYSFHTSFELDYFIQQYKNIIECMVNNEAYENYNQKDDNWCIRLWKCKEIITLQMVYTCDNGEKETQYVSVLLTDFLHVLKIISVLEK